MILTVSGWRHWKDTGFVVAHLERQLYWHGGGQIHLRVGCCKTGADRVVRDWVAGNRSHLASFTVYRADWDGLGRAAGPIRNGKMLRGQENLHDPNPNVLTDMLMGFPQPGLDWKKPGSGTTGCCLDALSLSVHLDVPGYKK